MTGNYDILNDLVNVGDRELIRRVPIPIHKRRDTWFWLDDEKGQFTVRSVYRSVQGPLDTTYAVFWKKLWNLQIPGKVVNFMWRVCRGCLPTLKALEMRRVNVNVRCPWCYSASESDMFCLNVSLQKRFGG